MSRNSAIRLAVAALAAPLLAGCQSGTGHVESFFNEIYPVDAAVAVGVILLTNVPDLGWNTRIAEQGDKRFRIEVTRQRWSGAGDGEFGRRFGQAAQRVVAENECGGFTVLSYAERYEAALLGTQRVAEGLIQCR